MKHKNRIQVFNWTALGLVISGTVAMVIIAGGGIKISTRNILLLLGWIWVVVPAFWLFFAATLKSLQENTGSTPGDAPLLKTPLVKKSPGKKEQFDIQGIANKIVRRVSPGDDPGEWGNNLLTLLTGELEIMSGVFYYKNENQQYESLSTYAYPHTNEPYIFSEGEGLTGQAVKNRQVIVYREIPDDYLKVFSGLGSGTPSYLAIMPVVSGDTPVAALEITGFRWVEENLEQFLQIIARGLAEKLSEESKGNNIGNTGGASAENRDKQ